MCSLKFRVVVIMVPKLTIIGHKGNISMDFFEFEGSHDILIEFEIGKI